MPSKIWSFLRVFTIKTRKKKSQIWGRFLTFSTLSRTWGINFDTIACLFELVDGLYFFPDFFRQFIFPKYLFRAYPLISRPQKWSKKDFEILPFFIFFHILSHPTLKNNKKYSFCTFFQLSFLNFLFPKYFFSGLRGPHGPGRRGSWGRGGPWEAHN